MPNAQRITQPIEYKPEEPSMPNDIDLSRMTDADLRRIALEGDAARAEINRRDDVADKANRQKRADEVVIGHRYFLSHMRGVGGWWVEAVEKTVHRGAAAVSVRVIEPLSFGGEGNLRHMSHHTAGEILPHVFAGNLYAKPEDIR